MERKPGRGPFVTRILTNVPFLHHEALAQVQTKGSGIVTASACPGVVAHPIEAVPQECSPDPTAIVCGIDIESGQVRIVDTGEPNDVVTVLGDEHVAAVDVLAFRVFRQRNEGACIEGSAQLVGSGSVVYSADGRPIVRCVLPNRELGAGSQCLHFRSG